MQKKNGCKQIALLKCTSTYPAPIKDANLNTINDMRKEFKCEVGLSDHTIGIGVPLVAICNGATLIEKHFTLSKKIKALTLHFHQNLKSLKNWLRSQNILENL